MYLATIGKIVGSNKTKIYNEKGIDDLLKDPTTQFWKTPWHFDKKVYSNVQDVQDVQDYIEESKKEVSNFMLLLKLLGYSCMR